MPQPREAPEPAEVAPHLAEGSGHTVSPCFQFDSCTWRKSCCLHPTLPVNPAGNHIAGNAYYLVGKGERDKDLFLCADWNLLLL